MTIEDVKAFYQRQYSDMLGVFIREDVSRDTFKLYIKATIQQCLGVAQFAQKWVEFEEIDKLYDEYLEEFETMEKEYRA